MVQPRPDLTAITASRAADAEGLPVEIGRPRLLSSRASPAKASAPRPHGALPVRMLVSAGRVTSGFGLRFHPVLGGLRQHGGIDLAATAGTPVVATADGTVRLAGWLGAYGLAVVIDHPDRLQTRYAHMMRLNVLAGQKVRGGEVIGYVGSTGRSTGPRLHYELRVNGQAVNPGRGRP